MEAIQFLRILIQRLVNSPPPPDCPDCRRLREGVVRGLSSTTSLLFPFSSPPPSCSALCARHRPRHAMPASMFGGGVWSQAFLLPPPFYHPLISPHAQWSRQQEKKEQQEMMMHEKEGKASAAFYIFRSSLISTVFNRQNLVTFFVSDVLLEADSTVLSDFFLQRAKSAAEKYSILCPKTTYQAFLSWHEHTHCTVQFRVRNGIPVNRS